MNRKGDWVQPFLLLFFALLVIVAIVLLTLEGKKLTVDRPELKDDLIAQRANAFLISLLRTQSSDNSWTIADLIIMDGDGSKDQAILDSLKTALPSDAYLTLIITYPDRRQVVISNLVVAGLNGGSLKSIKGEGTTLLPGRGGNINVYVLYLDRRSLETNNEITFKADEQTNLVLKTTTGLPPIPKQAVQQSSKPK